MSNLPYKSDFLLQAPKNKIETSFRCPKVINTFFSLIFLYNNRLLTIYYMQGIGMNTKQLRIFLPSKNTYLETIPWRPLPILKNLPASHIIIPSSSRVQNIFFFFRKKFPLLVPSVPGKPMVLLVYVYKDIESILPWSFNRHCVWIEAAQEVKH